MGKKVEKGINDFGTWCISNNHQDWLSEWNVEKNGELTPDNIGFGSEKTVWWLGKCHHEWETSPCNRVRSNAGCPYCSGHRVLKGFNDLGTLFPDIAKEFHPTKNGDLKPDDVTAYSNKKIWWRCNKNHQWEAVVNSRTRRGSACPFCSGRLVLQGFNDLATKYPEIAKEWHPTKNGTLLASNIAAGSNKRVWWMCKEGHEWDAIIVNRTNLGRGCPICGKNKMMKSRHRTLLKNNGSLADKYPEIAKEWHPTKNGTLLASNIAAGSIKKVWWLGKCGHEYEASVGNRTNRKSGCPYCSGNRVIKGKTDLKTKYPEIAKEWHPTKNGDLKPSDVTARSTIKVWWKCNKCNNEWEAIIGNRTGLKRGCPKCSRELQAVTYRENRIIKIGSLAETNPELAKEWHPIKNKLTPNEVSAGCRDKVWWLLPYDDPSTGKHFDFEWEASIASRNSGVGCPFLAGRCWTGFNDITITNSEILKYWDNYKNKTQPELYTRGSSRKVWWVCDYGHSFKSAIVTQCKKFSCPVCNKETQTSFPEQAIFYYIRQIFPDAINGDRNILDGMELDIFIPSQNVGIEYDGSAWHKNTEKDARKELRCREKGILLIRVREDDCEIYESESFLVYHYKYGDWNSLNRVVGEICDYLSDKKIDISIERDIHDIERMYFTDKQNNSAAVTNPELLSLWHPTKNSGLTLYQFNRGSEKMAWWLDSYGHEYKCKINQMTKGGDHCPYCLNRKLSIGFNDLNSKFPNVAAEWNYEKNGGINPTNVIYNRGKYWFKCKKCGNEWQAYLANRTRMNNPTGCPACGTQRAWNIKKKNYILLERYPELAKEWNYEKNGNLTPTDVSTNSKCRVWWKCLICDNEWQASVAHRTQRGSGCPRCNQKKHIRPVINVDTGIIYQSGIEAAQSVGISGSGGITMCCQGKQKTAGGYHWKYI